MEPFEIQWRASTKKDLRKLPPHEVSRIVAAVEALAQEPLPNGSEKLSGAEHTCRIRVGDYRVIYTVLTAFRIVEVQRCATSEGRVSPMKHWPNRAVERTASQPTGSLGEVGRQRRLALGRSLSPFHRQVRFMVAARAGSGLNRVGDRFGHGQSI